MYVWIVCNSNSWLCSGVCHINHDMTIFGWKMGRSCLSGWFIHRCLSPWSSVISSLNYVLEYVTSQHQYLIRPFLAGKLERNPSRNGSLIILRCLMPLILIRYWMVWWLVPQYAYSDEHLRCFLVVYQLWCWCTLLNFAAPFELRYYCSSD